MNAAIDARSRSMLISGLEQLSPTDLLPKKNPLPSASPHGMQHARRRSSALISPHVDKDLMVRTLRLPLQTRTPELTRRTFFRAQFLSEMAVVHLIGKIVTPLAAAVSEACLPLGLDINGADLAHQIMTEADGATFAAARKEAKRQLAKNFLEDDSP